MTIDLLELLVAEIEQAEPEQLARLRAALELEPVVETTAAVYTTATLGAELGRSPRAIRAAIDRGELAGKMEGGKWLISAEAVKRWATPDAPRRPRRTPGRRAPRGSQGRRPLEEALE